MMSSPQSSYTPLEPISHRLQFMAMTVPCQFFLIGENQALLAQTAQVAMAQTLALESKYNFYNDKSWLNTHINNRKMSQVLLDHETAKVLELVHQHSQLTSDAFDVCVGTIKSPFRDFKDLTLTQRQAHYQAAMGVNNWSVEGRLLTCHHQETLFDLGGVIKEYAVDKAMAYFLSRGIAGGMVNFGGDIISWGERADGTPFRAGILHPAKNNEVIASIALHNQSLTTSGHGQRKLTIKDQVHSHLIGKEHDALASMSVLSNSALISGIYSSALLINPTLYLQPAVKRVVRAFKTNYQGEFEPL